MSNIDLLQKSAKDAAIDRRNFRNIAIKDTIEEIVPNGSEDNIEGTADLVHRSLVHSIQAALETVAIKDKIPGVIHKGSKLVQKCVSVKPVPKVELQGDVHNEPLPIFDS